MKRLQHKVCVVTGAAMGIGAEVARRFAAEGAKVVLVDIRKSELEAAAAEIREAGGFCQTALLDLADAGATEALFRNVDETYGELHVLHTNAWWAPYTNVEDTTPEDWDKALKVTLTSPFLCSKYSIPIMRKSGGGSIIHTSSVGGVVAFRNQAAYIVAKAGVIHLCKSIAVDHGMDGIRANAILPGIIETPATQGDVADEAKRAYLESKCLLGRIGKPEDIANTSVFLASDESDFMTGSTVTVDSGWSII